jgi:hypothetical protein
MLFTLKLFYFIRIFDFTFITIKIIIETFKDSVVFLFIFFIGVQSLALMMYISARQYDEDTNTFTHNLTTSVSYTDFHYWTSVAQAFIFSYRMSLGDWPDTSDMLGSGSPIFATLLFLLGTLSTMIVMLNMVIALMSDTFARVKANEQRYRIQDHIKFINENFSIIKNSREVKKVKYLVVITVKDTETEKSTEEVVLSSIAECNKNINLAIRKLNFVEE